MNLETAVLTSALTVVFGALTLVVNEWVKVLVIGPAGQFHDLLSRIEKLLITQGGPIINWPFADCADVSDEKKELLAEALALLAADLSVANRTNFAIYRRLVALPSFEKAKKAKYGLLFLSNALLRDPEVNKSGWKHPKLIWQEVMLDLSVWDESQPLDRDPKPVALPKRMSASSGGFGEK